MGRRYKLTDSVIRRVALAFRKGGKLPQAAGVAGIAVSTLRKYIAEGEEDLSRYPDDAGDDNRQSAAMALVLAIEQAKARHAMGALKVIERERKAGNLAAAIFELERCHEKEYGKKIHQIEVDTDDKPLRVKLSFAEGKARTQPGEESETDEE